MMSMVLSLVNALVIGLLCSVVFHLGEGWCFFIGGVIFVGSQAAIGLIARKKILAANVALQNALTEAREKLSKKMNMIQQKNQGNVKLLQKLFEKEHAAVMTEALELTKKLDPYRKWNILLGKQINTMRMQFYYQMKNYEMVDKLLPKSLLMDPMSVAMKMARQHMRNDPGVDKTFEKKAKKFKGENAAVLYALYSWILVKRGDVDKAVQTLVKAKERIENPVLTKNWEHLVNGRVKKFSNAGLGEEWYALCLEEPKTKIMRQTRPY
jgi:tetratricopeptide (TPR) repeat protein